MNKPSESVQRSRDSLRVYLAYYEDQLETLSDFWLRASLDSEYGGYLVPTSRDGRTLGTDKNMWCQTRMTWMFAALYKHYEKRPEWLAAARLGRDFIVKHGYLGDGRWAYLLSRDGEIYNRSLSLVTDHNSAMALAEYAAASGSEDDASVIADTVEQYFQRVTPPVVDQWYHQSLTSAYQHNTVPMVTLGGMKSLRPYLGQERSDALSRQAIQQILYVQASDKHRAVFEAVGLDGAVMSSSYGQRVNPGHSLEAAWFCLEEAKRLGEDDWVRRAAEVCRWSFELGWDATRGGLYAFTCPAGGRPPGPETAVPWGERWDDRIWWVHSEALYALAASAVSSGDAWFVDRFQMLHNYIDQHFVDHEHGEWYSYLDPDGIALLPQKGTWIKCFFHIPRNIMMLINLLRSEAGASPQDSY